MKIGGRIRAQLATTMPGDVKPLSSDVQPLTTSGDQAQWNWNVRPTEVGEFHLSITVTVLRGTSDDALLPDEVIEVKAVSTPTTANWIHRATDVINNALTSIAALTSALGVTLAAFLTWVYRRVRRSRTRALDTKGTTHPDDGQKTEAAPPSEARPGKSGIRKCARVRCDTDTFWEDAFDAAVEWINRNADETFIKPILVVNRDSTLLDGNNSIAEYGRLNRRAAPGDKVTPRRGNAVIAFFPNPKTLDFAIELADGGVLCVVQWADSKNGLGQLHDIAVRRWQ